MKKKYKRILGILGLILVAILTAIAASLPSSEVQASESVTDTINVRVVGSTPSVTLSNITPDDVTVRPHETFKVTYENVNDIAVKLNRTDPNGVTTTYIIEQWQADYYPGEKTYTLNLDSYTSSAQSSVTNSTLATYQAGKRIHHASLTSNSNTNAATIALGSYGYGDFVVYVEAFGEDSVKAEDSVSFHYVPVVGNITTDTDSGFAILNLDYLPDSDPEGHVNYIIVDIYNDNDEIVWTTEVRAPQTAVTLPDLADGTYRIEISSYDSANVQLSREYTLKIKYEDQTPIPVPDTGTYTTGINLARTDYLITGLVIFGIITIAGLITLKKLNPNKARAHVNVKRRKTKK